MHQFKQTHDRGFAWVFTERNPRPVSQTYRELLRPEKIVVAHFTSKSFTLQWYSDGKMRNVPKRVLHVQSFLLIKLLLFFFGVYPYKPSLSRSLITGEILWFTFWHIICIFGLLAGKESVEQWRRMSSTFVFHREKVKEPAAKACCTNHRPNPEQGTS